MTARHEGLQSEVLRSSGVLIAASRDPDAKVTFLACSPPGTTRVVAKIASTPAAGRAVAHEAHTLVGLRRLALGELARTVPRYVALPVVDGRAALVASDLPGTPMSVDYHTWRHSGRRSVVGAELGLAADWLARFQEATTSGRQPLSWPSEVSSAVAGRWDGHPQLERALSVLGAAEEHTRGLSIPVTAVHGDFWFGNLLLSRGQVSGVVDWEAGELAGCPLRDLARFVLSYSLYLDRHVRPGRAVPGQRGLRRGRFGEGVRHALLGDGWYPRAARRFLAEGARRLDLPTRLWYDIALVGLGEVAVSANDDDFGSDHLGLLASLPPRPSGGRR